jgi:ABC-type multidrug transport system ATPase subunit
VPAQPPIVTVPRMLWNTALLPLKLFARRRAAVPLEVLKNLRGVFRPGTATVVLSSPGGGSSALLRVLTGRLQHTAGRLTFNGAPPSVLEAAGVNMRRLTTYCPEVDDHEPLLTVRETFEFAHKAAVVPVPGAAPATAGAAGGAAHGAAGGGGTYVPPDADRMLAVLGLQEARDTIIGSGILRGVSGGQKRRATLGEALLLNSRVLALDAPTTGLDSAVAHAVMKVGRHVCVTAYACVIRPSSHMRCGQPRRTYSSSA